MNRKSLLQGGIFALLLAVVCTIFFSPHFFVQAQAQKDKVQQTNDSVTPTEVPLVGPGLTLVFSVPGIASEGGNIKPLHPTRNVQVMLYKPDVNTGDSSVEPLFIVQGKATFDTDPSSPNYGKFVLKKLDLGDKVEAGSYQIVFKVDQALQKLITEKETDIGGIPEYLSPKDVKEIPEQTVVMGDIMPSPHGNNIVDIADYNAFMNCFGDKASSDDCTAKQGADLDDNGVIDGIDYNLLLLNLQDILAMGLPIPTLTSVQPTKAITPTKLPPPPAKKAVVTQTSQGSPVMGIFIILFFIILIVCGLLYFINPKFKAAVQSIFKKFPGGKKKEEAKAIPPTPETVSAEASVVPPAEPEEKSYYVKKQSDDDAKTGVWLNLTDDNGQTLAHYNKTDVVDGFAKIKGEMKTENDKTFLEISQLTPEA
jgi:hypothetical protein